MRLGALLAALLLVPSLVSGAGFAKQTIFLSQSPVTEGDSVLIHVVVSNDATTTFSGKLALTDNGISIGSVPVSLAARGADTVSISWKPSAGSRKIVAELQKGDTVIERREETFRIAEKPKPTTESDPLAAATIESSAGIQDGIENVSPAVAGAVAPVFTLIDGGRQKAAEVVESQLTGVKKDLGVDAGNILGAESTTDDGKVDPMGTFFYILKTLYFYLLTVLMFLISSAGVFYPVIAIAFLYILWRVFKRFRR